MEKYLAFDDEPRAPAVDASRRYALRLCTYQRVLSLVYLPFANFDYLKLLLILSAYGIFVLISQLILQNDWCTLLIIPMFYL